MAIWGNSANITRKTAGIVTCNYSTLEVVGSGTSFGLTDANGVGYAKTGQIIRFGVRGGAGGADDFFGDAVIVGVTSDRVLSIGSTAGLSGAAIAGTSFYISELPKSTITDHRWSNKHDEESSLVTFVSATALGAVALNMPPQGNYLPVHVNHWRRDPRHHLGLKVGDHFENPGGSAIVVAGLGTWAATTHGASGVGSGTIDVYGPLGLSAEAYVGQVHVHMGNPVDGDFIYGGGEYRVTAINAANIEITPNLTATVGVGSTVTFKSDYIVSLASSITEAISAGNKLNFQRYAGGYDRQIYGISTSAYDSGAATNTGFGNSVTEGWVGVTTYMGVEGEMRVKHEVLVAATGISTGDYGILYPTDQGGF